MQCECAVLSPLFCEAVEASWNVMAHAQKPDFVFRPNGRVHLNRPGGVISVDYWQPRCAPSAVVMLDTPCSEVVWRVLATHSNRHFSLHFPSRASPCAITFQLESSTQPVCVCCLRDPGCNAHGPYCYQWPTPLCNIFPYYLINGRNFERRKPLTQNVCIRFSIQFLSETFLILRRIQPAIIITVRQSSCEVPVRDY